MEVCSMANKKAEISQTASARNSEQANINDRKLIIEDLNRVSPALAKFAEDRLYGEVWKRPDLSSHDRSIATLAALIARNQNSALRESLKDALGYGVNARPNRAGMVARPQALDRSNPLYEQHGSSAREHWRSERATYANGPSRNRNGLLAYRDLW